jgi:UDP-glucose:(heptosyl)LPS alpha-1,3-glucosyltransferase
MLSTGVEQAAPGTGWGGAPADFRIAQVVQEFSRAGGVETVAFELQRRWQEAGVAADVLTATMGAETGPELARSVRFALPQGAMQRIPTRGAWRYLGRGAAVPAFTLAASAALVRGRRPGGWNEHSVVLSHGDSLVADVIAIHAVNAASLTQKRGDGDWKWALNPMHAWVGGRDRLMLGGRRARRYVAVSRRVVDELMLHHDVPWDRITIIPNGTDLTRFTPEGPVADLRGRFGIPAASRVLMFVGHEFDRKGLAPLIDALTQSGCETAHLVVVGAGDAETYGRLATAQGVGRRVHFTGPRHDLPALYRAADAFVLPTGYETFSLVCMEAMACGVPVFATRVGGIEDYLVDGVNGYMIERDGAAIAAALGPLLGDASHLAQLGRGAYSTAQAYGWAEVARRYHELLLQVWHEKRDAC